MHQDMPVLAQVVAHFPLSAFHRRIANRAIKAADDPRKRLL
jgi:hypothetical protein